MIAPSWRDAEIPETAAALLDNVEEGDAVIAPSWRDPEIPETAAALLDNVEEFVARFVAYPSEAARIATALWVAHAHMLDASETTPRIAFLSPEPASGKTRALEILELLTPRPLHAVNCTPAALFRSVQSPAGRPTILFDEIDTVFGPRAKDNEDIRGMLNAGYRQGAKAMRCVVKGRAIEVEEIDAYCAVALAGLGDLPDTIMTRAIVVRMRRRAPTERIEPYRRRINGPQGAVIAQQVAEWTRGIADDVRTAWPKLPDGIEDRSAEVWEPLLAIADAAGEHWPERARVAAVSLVTQSSDREASLGIRLLADLRDIFGTEDRLPTATILERLTQLEEAPWANLKGNPLDARGLAHRLKQYDVEPKPIRIGPTTARGYLRADLHDPFARYLSSENGVTDVTAVTNHAECSDQVPIAVEPDQHNQLASDT